MYALISVATITRTSVETEPFGCAVGLPVTAVFFSVVGGLVAALVMYCAGKRRRRGKGDQELAEMAPMYDTPLSFTRSIPDMELKENVSYGNKHNEDYQEM